MQNPQNGSLLFRSVEPLNGHRLHICTQRGDEVLFDFTPCLSTTRFADLKNDALFASASTDGANIIFKMPGMMPVCISAAAFLELMAKNPAGRADNPKQQMGEDQ